MPTPVRTPLVAGRGRRQFLARTALCGVLAGLGALAAAPASALPLGPSSQAAGGGLPGISQNGDAMAVQLNAPRTVIDWGSYNVAAGESVTYTFDDRGWIVLNRTSDLQPMTIDGVVQGRVGSGFGGNVWFVSKGGVIFGANARVDAGGLLATTGEPDLNAFLDTSAASFGFSGANLLPGLSITLTSGAQINGHGGLVALVAPSVVSEANTQVNSDGGGDVLFGAADSFRLRLAQAVAGDFDLVDFIVPSASAGSDAAVALDLQNATSANSVFVSVVSRTGLASAVVNLEGMITAQQAATDGGDVILSGGGGIMGRLPAATVGATNTDLYLNKVVASRDVVFQNSGQVFGQPWSRPLPPPPTNQELCGADECICDGSECFPDTGDGGDDGCDDPFNCSFGDIVFQLGSQDDPGVVSGLTAGRDAKLTVTGNLDVGRLMAVRDVDAQAGSLFANAVNAGRDLTLSTMGGDLRIAMASVAHDGAISGQNVSIDGLATGGGPVNIQAAGDIQIGDGASTISGGALTNLNAGGNVTVNAATGRLGTVTAGGAVNLRGGSLTIDKVTGQQVLSQTEAAHVTELISASDIYVFASNGDASVGKASAGDDIFVASSRGAASLGSGVLTGAGPDAVAAAFAGNPDSSGNGRVVRVESASGDARLGLGTGSVTGATSILVRASQDAFVDVVQDLPAAFQLQAGRDGSLRAPTASLSAIQAGRDVTLATTAGDFTATQPLTASRNISITAVGDLRLGDVTASNGSITLGGRSIEAGHVNASQDISLSATGGSITTASFRSGRDLAIGAGGDLTLSNDLTAVRNLTLAVSGAARVHNLTAGSGALTLTAGALMAGDLTAPQGVTLDVRNRASVGSVTAGPSRVVAGDFDLGGAFAAPSLQIESRSGALRLGGSAADGGASSGLWLDNAEFGRLRISGPLKVYAGATDGSARGDLSVLNLDVNPANTPQLHLYAGSDRNVLIQGVAAPTTSGGALTIGDPGDAAWRPDSILITGSLGSSTFQPDGYADVRAFTDLKLVAHQDILMGSERFIRLIQQTAPEAIDIGKQQPLGVTPLAAERFHVFVTAGRLEVSAEGKVVQQNTSPSVGRPVGIFLNGRADAALIIDPPQIVDLFGAYTDPDGQVQSGFASGGGVPFQVVDSSGQPTDQPAGSSFRFNSCAVGTTSCSGAGQAATSIGAMQQSDPILGGGDRLGGTDSASPDAGGSAVSNESLTAPPVLLGAPPPSADETLLDPVVTGAGSEEIWRERTRKAGQ
jgi:filamentous hemagglutinin family protein